MKGNTDLNKIIEKIINLRINEIIEKSDFDEKINNKIKDINDIIAKENKILKNRRKKYNIEKKDKKFSSYAIFVKDANSIIKEHNNLNYLSNDTIIEIKKIENKNAKEKFRELGKLWKNIDDKIKIKYKELTKNNDFTNEKYDNIVNNLKDKTKKKK